MVALALNGWTIPVETATQSEAEVGSMARSYSGKMRRNRRALKRAWDVTTNPLYYDHAVALEGVLLARGEQWPGDTDVFSAKGLPAIQDNGASVVLGGGKYGAAIWPRGATVNLLSSNQATGTDTLQTTSGFRAANSGSYNNTSTYSVISSSTDQAWQGTRCLKCVTTSGGGAGQGLAIRAAVSPSTQYTLSFYIRSAVNIDVNAIFILDQNNQTQTINGSNPNFVASSSAFNRRTVTFTTRATATSLDFFVTHYNDTTNTLYLDGLQLEASPAATTWGDGGFTGVNLAYDISSHMARGCEAFTVAGWLINPDVGGVAWQLTDGALGNRLALSYSAANVLTLTGPGGTVNTAWAAPSVYTHVAVVVVPKLATVMVYMGGVLVTTSTGVLGSFAITAITRLYFGNNNGASQWKGYVDELLLLPYVAPSAQLAAQVALATTPALQPNLMASGDMVGGIPLNVLASDVRASYLGGVKPAGFRSNLGKVQFTITEV